ncbi:glycosyltransferase [Mycobacterium haemophilum]|uniref:Glycosyl transferase n=1 Tax=Mycobacterium haemophilum TaxID=29311 RepID=A0A0I9XZY8_9MYCO|nr:glycosyltransferase [Mycobacterium haemophilum]KLO32782.1 glycosyl transferase [Mycobacterium haemophilum]KLO37084.1 glycosyl transferase [Mycobacterium haemophilum]KLO43557.1 glycosyl transferase [Mycobacterium haemophilum]KLO55915.1 glycosyl transferase [Mycobacterium haemophilum]
MRVAGEPDLQRLYRNRFGHDQESRSAIWGVLVHHFFQAWVRRSDTVVDLGCGYGEFLNQVGAARRIGVDLNPDSAGMLEPGVEFHEGPADDLHFLEDGSVDVVFTSNLLEHLQSKADVERMIAEAWRVLKPGGHFIAMGPNIRFLPGDYWDFWDHTVPISDRSLIELLAAQQFTVVDAYDRFLPYTSHSSLPQAPILVRLYLRLRAVWPIFGRQFVIRARKSRPPSETDNEQLVSVVLPVFNEGENIQVCVRGLTEALAETPHELIVCYDYDEDSTLPALAAMPDRPTTVRLVRNSLGKGVANALIAGFAAARGDVIVSTMADLSDPPSVIPLMAAKIREGCDVVSGSRYMPGGFQRGGPRLKGLMSRTAGLSLHYLGGMPTHDVTTNFRAYSRRFLDEVPVESVRGFEVGLELTTKAHLLGFRIDEVPSGWHDRVAGTSKFDLVGWLPAYLRWYVEAMWRPMLRWTGGGLAALGALLVMRRHTPGNLRLSWARKIMSAK